MPLVESDVFRNKENIFNSLMLVTHEKPLIVIRSTNSVYLVRCSF